MKQQIEDGLNAARLDGVLRLAQDKVATVAEYVLNALADREIQPTVEALPAQTLVATLNASDMVALIAKGSTSHVPTGSYDPVTTAEVYMGGGWEDETHLAWSLQPLFGVWAFASPAGGAVYMKIAGRAQDRGTFQSVLNGLLEAGRAHGSSAVFWQTLGGLIVSSDRAKQQIMDASTRTEASKAMCRQVWGTPKIIPRPAIAENGSPEYEAATKTLAEVAL